MPSLAKPRIVQRTPAELAEMALAGQLRVPGFQRLFRWTASDVVLLFDSIYRGYPIGNLLLWERVGEPERLRIGPLVVDAPRTPHCYWVVDGQQRVTSIVGALTAPDELDDVRFRIFFDLDRQLFRSLAVGRMPPRTWLPLTAVLSNERLLRWQRDNHEWLTQEHYARADALASAVVRDYAVPTYVVEAEDDQQLREVFRRVNEGGKRMTTTEVFQALNAATGPARPNDLHSLGDAVAGFGFGAFSERVLLLSLQAIRGRDVGRTGHREFRNDAEATEAFAMTERVLGDVIDFLRDAAGVPHVRLLPYALVVPVLSRFTVLFGRPDDVSAALLRRWLWRGAVAGMQPEGFTTALRRALAVLSQDAVASARRLLRQLPSSEADRNGSTPHVKLAATGLNQAAGKVNVLGMLALGPRNLDTGHPVSVVPELDTGGSPLRVIVPRRPDDNALSSSLANRVIHEHTTAPMVRLVCAADRAVLASHAITEDAVRSLAAGDCDGFLLERAVKLAPAIDRHLERMAEWGARDDFRVAELLGRGR